MKRLLDRLVEGAFYNLRKTRSPRLVRGATYSGRKKYLERVYEKIEKVKTKIEK